MSFQPIFFNWYLSNEKTAFVDKSSVEPTIFFIEKISFSLKLFSGHFYGQSFIKNVRGPFACSKSSYKTFQKANNKGPDQTVRMRRLVWAFVATNR